MARIIGLAGKTGSGKDAAARWVAAQGGMVRKHSAILRAMLERNGREPVPERMSALFEAIAGQLGYQWIAVDVAEDLQRSLPGGSMAAINGIRNAHEVALYRERFGDDFRLVALSAPQMTRFGRVRNRGERPNERDMSWDDFLAIESLEAHTGEAAVMAMADIEISNVGTLAEFHTALSVFRCP